MSSFEEKISKISARTNARKREAFVSRKDLYQACYSHLLDTIQPQLFSFEETLKKQKFLITTNWYSHFGENEQTLQAGLTIDYPDEKRNELSICYNFTQRVLIFKKSIGQDENTSTVIFRFSDLGKVTSVKVYEIIESFVKDVLSSEGLCDFEDPE